MGHVVLAGACLLAAVSCTSGGQTGQPADPASAGGESRPAVTGPAGGQVEVPERPIASARAQNQDLVLEVFRLARTSPRAVTLVFAVRNRGSEPISMLDFDLRSPEGDGDYIDGVSLFDPANLKQHLVYLDAQGRCLCSTYEFTQDYQPGRLRYFSAQFPAPPAGVREMTVITPIGSVANVPISQG